MSDKNIAFYPVSRKELEEVFKDAAQEKIECNLTWDEEPEDYFGNSALAEFLNEETKANFQSFEVEVIKDGGSYLGDSGGGYDGYYILQLKSAETQDYWKVEGTSSSYESFQITDIYKVEPKQVTVTKYKRA